MRVSNLAVVILGALALGGCAASIAAGAVGAAVRAANQDDPVAPGYDVGAAATQACTPRAAQHGNVHIIDVELRSASKAIVWGTVTANGHRRSFECRFDGKISDFKLREIGAQ